MSISTNFAVGFMNKDMRSYSYRVSLNSKLFQYLGILDKASPSQFNGEVVEMVDTCAQGAHAERREGSSPSFPTITSEYVKCKLMGNW